MAITGAYEGTYSDLLHFVNEIDRTKRLLIIENLAAQPQQGTGGLLNISIRFDTFVKEKLLPPQQQAVQPYPELRSERANEQQQRRLEKR